MGLLIDHYEILGVPPTASVEEIKTAFRQAALRLHPDKTGTRNESEFLKIQHAWDILSNSDTKAVYDVQRAAAAAREAVHITDNILIKDMESGTTEGGEAMVSWPCRCGGAYAVLEEELYSSITDHKNGGESENNSCEVVLPCSTCSLHILVVLNKGELP
jgi:diphthamide biosynthesis protein 4